MALISSGISDRFGSDIAFGLKRFEDSDKNALWRFRVSKLIGGPTLMERDADISEMRQMISWLERAIKIVRYDGGRIPEDSVDGV